MITIENKIDDSLISRGLVYKNGKHIGGFLIDKEAKKIAIKNQGDISLNDTIDILKLVNGQRLDYFQFELEINQSA